jgi:hypothetical protein
VRELGTHRHKEFRLSDKVLDSYAGDYPRGKGDIMHIKRLPDGLLSMTLSGQELVLHAMSQTKFFATTTDVQIEFKNDGDKRDISYNVGED